ncbi:MAG: ROK family protein [Gemmatimonadaceae bacterium]
MPSKRELHTLAVDIGGTGIKAAVLDGEGEMITDRVRVLTPPALTRQLLVRTITGMTESLPDFDRVSVGFPGVVRNGVIKTAVNVGGDVLRNFDLAGALERRLGRPTRVLNDADMAGFGAARGKGVEMVVTLGTGVGTALFDDGRLCPHMELAHHPFRKGETYEDQIGDAARKRLGAEHWSRRVAMAVELLRELLWFDRLYLGGGNARRLTFKPPRDVTIVDNSAGLLGGIRLWDDAVR